MKKRIKSNALVTKSNKLIEAHYKLTSQEQKLVLAIVSLINPKDADFQEYMIPVEDYKRIMDVKGKGYSGRLRQKARALMSTPLSIPRDHGGRLLINWFSSIEEYPQKGSVGICFDPKLKPFLLSLRANFTKYELQYAAKLSSSYSIRLYELLKQYENTDTKQREFEFEDLKKILGCQNRYKAYSNFKLRVLEAAKKELVTKTDISFTYKVRKLGRRVNWIIFIIKPRKKAFIDDGQGEIDSADIYSPSDVPAKVLKFIPEKHRYHQNVLRDIMTYVHTHGIAYVIQKVAYTVKQKPKDFAAYLGNALKRNFGGDFDPYQMQLFEEVSPSVTPGMRVLYEGQEYTVHEGPVIYPKTGGCQPLHPGPLAILLNEGKVQIVKD
ncbi:MAG: replication initiation protein [Desulfobacteraceae bacterium]|nr:replication initiation protein [Desulfobacteraceae bacterium]